VAVLTRDGRFDRLLLVVPVLDTSDKPLPDDDPELTGAVVIGLGLGFGG